MESRRPSDLSLPYKKVALWGIAVSVLATGAFLAASPCSPVRMAERALDGRDVLRGAVFLDGRHLPTAAEVSRRAVGEVLGMGSAELAREWTEIAPELREEMRREVRQELRGLHVEVDASPPGVWRDGG